MRPTNPPPNEHIYPADDEIRADLNWHYKQTHMLVDILERRFMDWADVFVGGDIFLRWYDDSGQWEYLSADVMIAVGVGARDEWERGEYRVWEEGVPPAVVIEIESGRPMDYR